jgi:hypothetical protein
MRAVPQVGGFLGGAAVRSAWGVLALAPILWPSLCAQKIGVFQRPKRGLENAKPVASVCFVLAF